MIGKQQGRFVALMVLLTGSMWFVTVPLHAGGAAIGVIVGSQGATLDQQEAHPQTALFDGDALHVNDHGLAVVKLTHGGNLVLERQTKASFVQEADALTVRLEQGHVSFSVPQGGRMLRVRGGSVSVEPVKNFATLGDVSLLNGRLVVTAQQGRLRVQGKGLSLEATKEKPVTLESVTASAPQLPGAGVGIAHAAPGSRSLVGVGIAAAGAAGGVIPAVAGEKNPTAVEQVAAHAPDQACDHAVSPSVPSVACQGR